MLWNEYKTTGKQIEEATVVLKTVEAAVDYVLDNAENKKEALSFIDKSPIDFIKKNSKKIKEMINKLPNSMF